MRKIQLTFLLLLFSSLLRAQFFHHNYYGIDPLGTEGWLWSGANTKILSPGHCMAGAGSTNGAGGINQDGLIVTYTDPDGNISGAPYFNNTYTIHDAQPGGVIFTKIFEYNGGFGIIGTYVDQTVPNGREELFYIKLNSNGSLLLSKKYSVNSASSPLGLENSEIRKSSSGNELYVCGIMWDMSNHPFVMKIDIATGNIIWSEVYDLGHSAGGFDIIESPYNPSGVPELVLVGYSAPNGTATQDGMMIRLNANTGAVVSPWPISYGTNSLYEELSSITISNSPSGGSTGFVIGGRSGVISSSGNTSDFWLLKIDPTGGVIWSTISDYAQLDLLNTVIERQNTMGNYEYYAGGDYDNGSNNGDIMVLKTDDMGIAVPGGVFTYGIKSNTEACRSLDQYNGTAHDGLSIYASNFNNTSNDMSMLHVKAYFNGVSGCDEKFGSLTPTPGPGVNGESSISTIYTLKVDPLTVTGPVAVFDATTCYTANPPGLPGGNNARTAIVDESNATTLSPNPVNRDNNFVAIKIFSQTGEDAQVYIYDLSGRRLLNKTYSLVEGNNSIQLDLSELNLSAGIYNVSIKRTSGNEYFKLSVE